MTSRTFLALWLVMVALVMAGCGGDTVTVQRNPDGGADISVTLSEADLNSAVERVQSQMIEPLLNNVQADIQPGEIVLTGEYNPLDGPAISGTITLDLRAEDGGLVLSIVRSDVAGFAFSQERLDEFNFRLAERLGEVTQARETERGTLTYTNVQVGNDQIEIFATVQRN